jgi:hypothetical protein
MPARRRDAVRFLVRRRPVSERRACQLVGQHRSTQRYQRLPAEYELRLVARTNEPSGNSTGDSMQVAPVAISRPHALHTEPTATERTNRAGLAQGVFRNTGPGNACHPCIATAAGGRHSLGG